ncbi:MAG: CpXC domain-containing protein [Chloroflexales bacterium]
MPPVAPQPVQLTCPSCGTPFRAGIYTLIDVTQQPELKQALLSGQLNVAVCPNCQMASMLGTPLIYHDAAKQLCLVYFPAELNAPPSEQERFVGEATSFIMKSLPPNAPRAYLLNPRRFLTLTSLMDTVLEADGISREMLDAQRRRVELISQLAGAAADGVGFDEVVAANRAELTPGFFATLDAFIGSTPPSQAESRALLEQVRDQLAEEFDAPDSSAEEDAELAAALDRLASAPDEELEETVAELRAFIDYGFFQAWTDRIERHEAAGQTSEAEALSARRTRILDMVEELDRQAQEMFESGSSLLREVLTAEDPMAALHARAADVGEAFLMVLSANIGAAQRAGEEDLAVQLDALGEAAVGIIQDRLSPEDRFINELMLLETPQEATRLLRKSVAKITPDLVKQLNALADQEEKRGNKPAGERLRQLARESGAMLF